MKVKKRLTCKKCYSPRQHQERQKQLTQYTPAASSTSGPTSANVQETEPNQNREKRVERRQTKTGSLDILHATQVSFKLVKLLQVRFGLFPHPDHVEVASHSAREHADFFADVLPRKYGIVRGGGE